MNFDGNMEYGHLLKRRWKWRSFEDKMLNVTKEVYADY